MSSQPWHVSEGTDSEAVNWLQFVISQVKGSTQEETPPAVSPPWRTSRTSCTPGVEKRSWHQTTTFELQATRTGRSLCVRWVCWLTHLLLCTQLPVSPKLSFVQVRVDTYNYIGMGNSTNKKDAQTNAARDFVNYLVRIGEMSAAEVPAHGVRTQNSPSCSVNYEI